MKYAYFLMISFMAMQVSAQSGTASAKVSDDSKVWRSTEVDLKPQVTTGNYSLSTFMVDNFKFPEGIKSKAVKIFASFIVETDGTMSDIKAYFVGVKELNSGDPAAVKIQTEQEKQEETVHTEAMKAETLRVLSLFKDKWQPAQKGGKPVRCLYNYPINFNVE